MFGYPILVFVYSLLYLCNNLKPINSNMRQISTIVNNIAALGSLRYALFSTLLCALFLFVSCGDGNDPKPTPPSKLGEIAPVSLSSKSSIPEVTVSRSLKDPTFKNDDFWIKNIDSAGNKVTFEVIENNYYEKGFRGSKIDIYEGSTKIGEIPVYQARPATSNTTLQWCNNKAIYREEILFKDNMTALDAIKFVYNLEKTTGGKDSYKNYPAFAYCIEMNYDPENNMEWYLPEVLTVLGREKFDKYDYYWSCEDLYFEYAFTNTNKYVIKSYPKSSKYWVRAFNSKNPEW